MTLGYHPAVRREVEEARDYYEKRAPGLGIEFVNEFERQVIRIASTPRRWLVVEADVRRALMKRFPYVIYFRQTAPEHVRITAVKHQRRHPAYARDRR
jgi:plasmid stabilization system protein ParE